MININNEKLISIVLPTYNGSKCIKNSIESVLNQTYTNFELIIVNDASTDNTLDIINDYAKKDNRIKIINNDVNKKLPASLNVGFREAKGEYLTWTSDDNKYHKDALYIMADELNDNPNIDMVYANFNRIKIDGTFIEEVKFEDPDKLKYYNVIGACFLYRNSMKEKIGEYDEELFLAEDYEYWIRVYLNGNIKHIDKTLYDYSMHEKSLTSTRVKEVLKATIKTKLKHEKELLKKCINQSERNEYYRMNLYYINDINEYKKMRKNYYKNDIIYFIQDIIKRVKNKILGKGHLV